MNRAYRFCWNMARNNWLATSVVTLTLLMADKAHALPINGQTAAGKATISTQSSSEMHIVQGSNRAIINWDSFSIGKGESVNITQPSSQSTMLNRVLGNNPSEIFGSLTANGQLFLINPGGVLFAPGASINAGGLVASTLGIKNSDFLSEKYSFLKTGPATSVINQGNINAGFAALLGSSVENSGTIITSKGLAGIAVGKGITLNMDPSGLVAIKVDEATYNAQINNSGVIEANDGTVVMTATAANAMLSTVVNNSGKVLAGTITESNGNIIIESGTIINSGIIKAEKKIDASAAGAMINTGKLSADDIKVNANNLIDAGCWESNNILIHATGSMEQTAASTISADGQYGGHISISAGNSLYLSGAFSACGSAFQGGEIRITAPETILAGTKVKTDGVNGGGRIFIGGGWQGNDITLANAESTLITSSNKLTANALEKGNGGTVVLWSNQSTSFSGTIEAKGGKNYGNGGNVEVSSHDKLTFGGNVVTASPKGENGLLLLDPRNITIENNPTAQTFTLIPLIDANPKSGNKHGSGKIIELANGNIIISSPSDDFAATDAGAVRLYRPDGTLLSMLTGSTANDMVGYNVTALTGNNNAVASTPNWSNSGLANSGAVTWINGATGISGNVSAINSLVGSSSNDCIGSAITVLTNGNYVVSSPHWNSNTGAASWGNGATFGNRLTGTISDLNSLVGSSPNDAIGTNVTVLTNGNYVVSSGFWDKVSAVNTDVIDAGSVTWCDGLGSTTGMVSTSNSLFGSNKNDFTGSNDANSNNVTALTNGNYVVCSGYWDNGKVLNAGAVTWGNGNGGTIGAVSADNSLVGSKTGNQVGYGNGAVIALSNGNYVVTSALWDNGTATNAGAVTWGSGSGGAVGVVSALNSLVGSTKNDYIGSDDVASNNVRALTNGNYVVSSKFWDNGTVVDVGAVCWGNGLGGTVGTLNASNSLVGSHPNDRIGSVVTALSNGHYVVGSPNWNSGAGAATWGNGKAGGTRLTGEISVGNSLVGSSANDSIGSSVIALTNGHYVVASPNWNNSAGEVSWGDGETGGSRLTGTISVDNSLIGSSANDGIGHNVTVLTNGNYVASSGYWDKINADNSVVTDTGAISWGCGLGGTTGKVSGNNSLIGSTKNDYAGSDDLRSNNVTALPNGNYVVSSKYWDNNSAVNAGGVTWGNGLGGTVGAISTANSLVGSRTGNQVGSVTVLPNSNYVVTSLLWDNGSATNAGAVSWCNGVKGSVGVVTSFNSMAGSTKEEQIGSGGITPLTVGDMKGCFVVSSPAWLNSSGRVDIFAPLAITQKYTSNPATDNTLTPYEITTLLNAGENVILKANNDITLNSDIFSSNPSINSGNLALHAGRSILMNANISTRNGNLTLTANDSKESGVADAFRADGSAVITMGAGSSINTGSGSVTIELHDGAGNTNRESGNITLRDITAGTISAVNNGLTTGSGFTLASGTLAANATSGSSIVLAGRNLDNSQGCILSTSGTARWLVYSDNPGATIKGGLTSDFRHYNASQSNYAPKDVSESGNGFIYTSAAGAISVSPTLVGGSASSIYGTMPAASFGYTLSSSDNEDTIGNIGLTGTMIVTGVPTAASNAGNYTISYGGGLSSTIGLTFTAGTGLRYTVDKRPINISANAVSKTYGDADNTLNWLAETQTGNRGLIPGDGFSGVLGRTAGENVGTFAINRGSLANSNYTINYNGSNLTINPRPITLQAMGASRVYGETDPKLAVDITTGSLGSVTVNDTLSDVTGTLTRQTGSDVGSYDIALGSGIRAGNYAVTFATDNNAFSITQRPIIISADDKSKTYSISDPKLTWVAESKSSTRGLLSGDSFSGTLGRTAGENVGSYKITQGSLSNNNYVISLNGASLRINPRPITLHATSKSKIYGEPDPNLAVSITSGTLGSVTVSDELNDITGTLTRQPGNSVGSYDISLGSGTRAGNYAVTFATDNNAFSITQRPIIISADDKSKTYSITDPKLTWVAESKSSTRGLLSGDSFSGTLGRTAGENVGSYKITQGSLNNKNYLISLTAADLTITARPITLQATATSRIYGETDPKLAVDITTGSLGSVTVNDTLSDVTGTLTRQTGSGVGSYDIALGSGTRAGNYAVTFATDNNAFSITQRPIIISADDKSKTYSISDPKLTWVAESKSSGRGLIYGDSGSFSGKLGRTPGENVGSYEITQGSLNNNNYLISLTAADLTITARPITLHATSKSKIYGESDPNLAVSITSGTLGSATVSDELVDITGTLTRQAGNSVGSYDISLGSGTRAGNYAVTFASDNSAFSITQRPIIISADDKSKSYGESDPTLTWQSNSLGTGRGLIPGDSFSGALERTDGENAGAYTINQGKLGNGNYKISFHDANLTIDKRILTLSAIKTYDGETSLTGSVTLGNLAGNETLNYTGATSKNKEVASNATNYINAITLQDGSGLTKNYTLPTLNIINAPVRINPRAGDLVTDTKNSNGGGLTDKTLSTTVTAANISASKIKSIQQQASHDAGNTGNGQEFFKIAMGINPSPVITIRDLPVIEKSKLSSGESSQALKPVQASAAHDIFAVSAIEAHEPAMEFFILPIPQGTFKHNNPEAVISIEVRLVNGSSIPSWMSFDPKQKVLSGTPPQDAKGAYQVELIAKDQFGGEARTVVFVNVG